MSLLVLKNFRIVDEEKDTLGSVIVENGVIKEVYEEGVSGNTEAGKKIEQFMESADAVLDGKKGSLVLMPSFVDLHAHFRESGFYQSGFSDKADSLPSETLESASLAAAAGGFGTVVSMANTKPVTDTIALALAVKNRCDALGLVDLYPALSLSRGMEGKELSEFPLLNKEKSGEPFVRLLSEDGKDVASDSLFLAAMAEARRIGVPLSCHCDLDGENNATSRALRLGGESLCRLHIAHVSTGEAVQMIRKAKKDSQLFSCEVTPHHISLTEKDAGALGLETHGRVNPPLRTEEDRKALIAAIADGTIDAIATDHAPHSLTDKENGSPGFTALETAFAVCYSTLVMPGIISFSKLSSLMSASPARILSLDGKNGNGFYGRGIIAPDLRADFAVADPLSVKKVDPAAFFSRGKNSPFAGRELTGSIVMTIRGGRVVFNRP